MARLSIVLYPDPVLLRPTERVEQVDDSVRQLVADMVETMHAAPGIGLAANQVQRTERICVVDISAGQEEDQLHVFVNPEILETEGLHYDEEGCLSFPGINIDVERPFRVRVRALDLEGAPFEFEADGLLGRCIQHECEHLDGHTFLRNLSGLKRGIVKRRIRKRIQDGDWEAASAP
jgi:peptide deformylase